MQDYLVTNTAPETIAALATPPGSGGIGVIRVSGIRLNEFANALTGCNTDPIPRNATLVSFKDGQHQLIDSGLLLYFPAPHSFTGEDVLEIQGHGGRVVMQMLLSRCLELGARLAEPGEFSRRAYLNDKMDLAQAEGVADLIEAASAQAVRSAHRSLSGEFSQAVKNVVDQLIHLRLLIEATLDFPEEEIDAATMLRDIDAEARLQKLTADLANLRTRARQGSVLRSGLVVVLMGLPNAGKSSLLNRLAGDECAIVTEVAGTTRDALRETIQIEGIPLHIIDTAGLRETADVVEKLGIARTWKEIERADVVLQIIDARTGITPADRAIAVNCPGSVERLVVENKCDLAHLPAGCREEQGHHHVRLSAKTGEGIHYLHNELLRIAGWTGHGEDVLLARERHMEALTEAANRCEAASAHLTHPELTAEECRLAQEALSRITGEFTADDLLGEIFSRFCIGK
ncbi:MAG: tRNA uridine-5-carboxymethylaminomethyl(34) synthesis GTPase MnmE [Rhodocyclaceae bacterium]|nr:tRNA uridine-5-carboxymethylaminomethyl(34) synthesis GTPase MnmE [Rhodocyclaceae bacterium]